MNSIPISPLFVPANKLQWVPKADSSEAGALIFDLEDSVPPDEKERSREELVKFLISSNLKSQCLIRVNPLDSAIGKHDLDSLKILSNKIKTLMVPKIQSKEGLKALPKTFEIIALIETPKAVLNLDLIASHNQVRGLALGAADLSSSLGSDMEWQSLLYTRSKMVLSASINNLYLIDSPYTKIDSKKELESECKLSKSLGFIGKAAIHPSQIPIIRKNFLPSKKDIKEAKEIIRAFSSEGGVIAVNGKMIDRPIVNMMENKLLLVGINPEDYK